jgi:hypothetical protein
MPRSAPHSSAPCHWPAARAPARLCVCHSAQPAHVRVCLGYSVIVCACARGQRWRLIRWRHCAASMRAPPRSFHSTGAPVRQLCRLRLLCSLPPCSSLASKLAVAHARVICCHHVVLTRICGVRCARVVAYRCHALRRRLQSAFKLAVALGRIEAALLLLDSPITATKAESPPRLQPRHGYMPCVRV